jgi:hypothetical protein
VASSGESPATWATAERRGGIWPVALDMRARASAEVTASRSRMASLGLEAWRKMPYTMPPARVAGAPRGPPGTGANPKWSHSSDRGRPAALARRGPS